MSKKKIAVSVAHHPKKPGACFQGVCEHAESIRWSERLLELLETKGFDCFRAPIGRLPTKVKAINSEKCDLALEIHFNSAANAVGCETLYFPGSDKGRHAATAIQVPLAVGLGVRNRGVKEGWYRMDRPGILDFYGDKDGDEMPNYFLRKTNCTALILEPEFIQNIDFIQRSREAGCRLIASSLGEYFT